MLLCLCQPSLSLLKSYTDNTTLIVVKIYIFNWLTTIHFNLANHHIHVPMHVIMAKSPNK